MRAATAQFGFIPAHYATTDQNHLITIYIGELGYVITIEDMDIACVIAHGPTFNSFRGFDL